MQEEKWKNIPGYEGLYQASTRGNIRGLTRVSGKGKSARTVEETILKGSIDRSGHRKVELWKDGKKKSHKVHRLVAETFKKNPKNKELVGHIDGNKLNNRVENLEYMTRDEVALLLKRFSPEKLKPSEKRLKKVSRRVRRSDGKMFNSVSEAARYVGSHKQNIIQCCQGKINKAKGWGWEYVDQQNEK